MVSMFAALLVGLSLGYPIAFVMGGIGLIFGLSVWGPECLLMFGLSYPYRFRYGWNRAHFWVERMGPLRGGLALTVIMVGTVFAACTGIIGASIVTLGLLSLPMLLRYGYDKPMSLGVICAAGSLGIIIAPSIMLVIMGSEAALSVGKLFMAAFFPGLLLSASYFSYEAISHNKNPALEKPNNDEP